MRSVGTKIHSNKRTCERVSVGQGKKRGEQAQVCVPRGGKKKARQIRAVRREGITKPRAKVELSTSD